MTQLPESVRKTRRTTDSVGQIPY